MERSICGEFGGDCPYPFVAYGGDDRSILEGCRRLRAGLLGDEGASGIVGNKSSSKAMGYCRSSSRVLGQIIDVKRVRTVGRRALYLIRTEKRSPWRPRRCHVWSFARDAAPESCLRTKSKLFGMQSYAT